MRIGLLTSLLFAAPVAVIGGNGDPRVGMGKIKDYFTDRGLTAADLPKALVFHEVISVAFAAFTWSVSARRIRTRGGSWHVAHELPRGAPQLNEK